MVSWFDDAQDEDDEFIEAAKAIRLLALDVDGVLTKALRISVKRCVP